MVSLSLLVIFMVFEFNGDGDADFNVAKIETNTYLRNKSYVHHVIRNMYSTTND